MEILTEYNATTLSANATKSSTPLEVGGLLEFSPPLPSEGLSGVLVECPNLGGDVCPGGGGQICVLER